MMIAHARRTLSLTILAAGIGIACTVADPTQTSAPRSEPADPAALERARAFQLEYDRALREDDRSFLTVIAAYYFAPGDELKLALVDGIWAQSDPAALHFTATPEQLILHRTDGADDARFSEATLIPAGDDGR